MKKSETESDLMAWLLKKLRNFVSHVKNKLIVLWVLGSFYRCIPLKKQKGLT